MGIIEEQMYHLVTFEQPIRGSKLHRVWVCVIGGIEFSGENKKELRQKAIQILKDEIVRLEKEGG